MLEALRAPAAAVVDTDAPPALVLLRVLGVGLVALPGAATLAAVLAAMAPDPPQQHVARTRSNAVEGPASKLTV